MFTFCVLDCVQTCAHESFKVHCPMTRKLAFIFLTSRWLNFEKVLNALLSKKVYHLNLRELETYVRDNCFINDEEEFTTMVDFYHDLGIIIKHCSTVIVSAEWLIDVFKQLIIIPPFNETVRSEIRSVSVFKLLQQLSVLASFFLYLTHNSNNTTIKIQDK